VLAAFILMEIVRRNRRASRQNSAHPRFAASSNGRECDARNRRFLSGTRAILKAKIATEPGAPQSRSASAGSGRAVAIIPTFSRAL
jgi:hypothetical protein